MNEPPFGDLLNQWRVAKGLTLREVGEAVGVSAIYICDIEHGNRLPSTETAMRLCALFEMQPLDYTAQVLREKFQKKAGDQFAVEVKPAHD